MPNTWATDINHFLNESGSIAPESGPARRLAEHIVAIIAELSAELAGIEGYEEVSCRRRPGRRPCTGTIASWIDPETGEICWQCPICEDNGFISNWEGTMWDLANEATYH